MKIKQHPIKTGEEEYLIDIEIGHINWENDSIGWYEYGSAKEFDHQKSYAGEFEIKEIIVDGIKVEGITFDVFHDILMEDETLVKRIEKQAKEEIEANRVERLLDRREKY